MVTPLGEAESATLAQHLRPDRQLSQESLERIVDAADGNPLFVEQLLALNADDDGAQLVVPPTIQALLAARIDTLEADERTMLECAAVEGREFHRDALVALLPPASREEVGTTLLSLARRQFIRPHRSASPNGEAFAFAHGLMRDAAYAETPKETRAQLHVQLADHLEQLPHIPIEIVGHHLAKACRYRLELGRRDETTQELARRAADRLAAGGRRALDLGDDRAAAKLFDHACELVSADDPVNLPLYIEFGRALAGAGQLDQARGVLTDARSTAQRAGDAALELRAELGLLSLRSQTDASLPMAELVSTAERALPVFSAAGDERGLARSWYLMGWAQFRTGQYDASIEAGERVIEHSGRAGDTREQLRALGAIAMATLWGSTPVAKGFVRCDELDERAGGAQLVQAFTHRVRGGLCSMSGAFEDGRGHCHRAIEIYEELGHPISALGVVSELQRVERQAGMLDSAERELRVAYARLQELGDVGYLSWVAAQLARVLAEQGQGDEALELARFCREELQGDHAFAQVAARLSEAIALTRSSRGEDARAIALEALALVERTDMLDLHGDVLLVLGEIEPALALYEQKGDIVSAARARPSSVSDLTE
jgi:tetratricopeptide (TPR) repeat protein